MLTHMVVIGAMIVRVPPRSLVQMLSSSTGPATRPGRLPTWRPTLDDVERISWGKPAKKKGTGSRGVPHRLNDDERKSYDIARRKGFLEVAGSGWRKERRGTPLLNTYRLWCDASAVPAIFVQKSAGGDEDGVSVDLSPLRMTEMPPGPAFQRVADECIAAIAEDGVFETAALSALVGPTPPRVGGDDACDDALSVIGLIPSIDEPPIPVVSGHGDEEDDNEEMSPFMTEPIFRLPEVTIVWVRSRSESKKLAKRLAAYFGLKLETGGKGPGKGRTKERGAPSVRPGKSRRHGGYGIG